MVGDGPLLGSIQRAANATGLGNKIVLAGMRNDVPEILSSVADVFILPSLTEGLAVVTVESQAAGVPVLASSVLPPEAALYEGGLTRLPLSTSATDWAAAIASSLRRKPFDKRTALAKAAGSAFEIGQNARLIADIYFKKLELS